MIPHLDLALEAAYKRSITLSINNSIELELQYFFLLQQSEQSTSMLAMSQSARACAETLTQPRGVYRHSANHAARKFLAAQCAFKILMILEVLQFALRIAFRCVLHHCGNQDIHC